MPALPWRDTDLQIEGPVVAEFQKLFIETWEGQKGPPAGARKTTFPQLEADGRARWCARSAVRPTNPTA